MSTCAKTRLTSLAVLPVAAILTLLLVTSAASGQAPRVKAEVTVSGGGLSGILIPLQTIGGAGTPATSFTGTFPNVTSPADPTLNFGRQSLTVEASAEVATGRVEFYLAGSLEDNQVPGSTPSGYARVFMKDEFVIGPGISGLANGAPVQVRFHAALTGLIKLAGSPSGGSELTFTARLFPYPSGGSHIEELLHAANSLYPPQSIRIDREQDVLVDVHVGDVLRIESLLIGTMNSSSSPARGGRVSELLIGNGLARLYQAPGFEGIEIGAAGALRDTDGDGLADKWETGGYDWNGDGAIDLALSLLGADPQHKDLFLELDYMASHRPDQNAVDDVIAAFASAPMVNPDGLQGIDLHVLMDDEILHQETLNGFEEFDAIKADVFGTAAERADPNWENIREARKRVYRYGLFAHQRAKLNDATQEWEPTTSSGLGEIPGNDFMVTLGAFTQVGGHGVGTRDEQAGTLMHEFGHTLGFDHGGADRINYKPNYLSVMNYSFQFERWATDRPLDYSRDELPPLNESHLNENDGIAGTPCSRPLSSLTAMPMGSMTSGCWRQGVKPSTGTRMASARETTSQPMSTITSKVSTAQAPRFSKEGGGWRS